MIETDILVIGAGLAGLTLARKLAGSEHKIVLIEKSKSAGGRLSTRRSEAGSFDHGAQYLTSRTPEFSSLLKQMSQNGDLAQWKPVGKDSEHPWWVGHPGMSTIGKILAGQLEISYQIQATRIVRQDRKFLVHTQGSDGDGPAYRASRIIAAIPAPQALALLAPLDPAFAEMDRVIVAPCWTTMLAFDERLPSVGDLIRGSSGDVLALIARNGSKPGRTGETFVIHATPGWSRTRIEDDRETVKSLMLDAFQQQTGLAGDLPEPIHCVSHRWRFAFVEKPLGRSFIGNSDNTLFACGDWCIAPRAAAAHGSGLALAHHIMSL